MATGSFHTEQFIKGSLIGCFTKACVMLFTRIVDSLPKGCKPTNNVEVFCKIVLSDSFHGKNGKEHTKISCGSIRLILCSNKFGDSLECLISMSKLEFCAREMQ